MATGVSTSITRPACLLLVSFLACTSPWATVPPLGNPDYGVYRVVIAQLAPTAEDSLPILETLGPYPEATNPSQLPVAYLEPFADLQKADPRRLEPAGLVPLPVHVVPYSAYKSLRTRPDSVLTLSRVGYSRDSSRAVVYVSAVCRLCGTGRMTLLQRDSTGGWTQASQVVWNAGAIR